MVGVGQNWRLDCNKSLHSAAELVPGRSIDTVSFCGWAPCHAEAALCENTSCKIPSSRMGNFFVMSSSSIMASQSTLAFATRIGWKPSALMFHFWIPNGSGKPRKSISRNTKRMAAALLALSWIRHYKALTLTTLQRIRQLKTQKLYMHVDGRQKKECTVSRGRLCLMYVMHLSTMTMQLPLAQMSNRDGEAGMETVLWDISVIPNGTGRFLGEFYI